MDNGEHLHRRLSDPSLASYFGQYFTFLRWLRRSGVRWFNRIIEGRYYTAQLSIKNGDHLHVGLDAKDVALFEFFTTGSPIVAGKFACIGVTATIKQGTVSLTPTLRTGARSLHGQTISAVERPFQVQLIDESVAALPPSIKILQRPKYFNTLYETWAPGHSHTGVHLTSYNQASFGTSIIRTNETSDTEWNLGVLAGTHGSYSAHATRDVQFDQWFQLGFKDRPVTGVVLNDETAVPPPDWPRANGVQMVKSDAWGSREFAVYIDAFSQVSVFPTSQISGVPDAALDQNIDAKYVKLASAGLPGWVYQMSERFRDWYAANATAGLADFPENDWKLHPLGTKACAVVYKRQAVVFDAAFWNTGVTGGSMSVGEFNTYYQSNTGYTQRHGTAGVGELTPRYISATGLLELGIAIALTGPNDEDFTLNVTCTTVRDPESTDYCTLFAGYPWYDMTGVTAGDLCVWDIERYYKAPTQAVLDRFTPSFAFPYQTDHERFWTAGTHVNGATLNVDGNTPMLNVRRTLYSLKNLTQATELRTLPAPPSGVGRSTSGPTGIAGYTYATMTPWEPRAQFVNVDMKTLSFVLAFQTGTQEPRTVVTPGFGTIPSFWFVLHPGHMVYTFNTFREGFFPETIPQVQRDKLLIAADQDFRDVFLTNDIDGGDWTLMTLAGGPPGKAGDVDWTDNEMGVLRYLVLQAEGRVANSIAVLDQRPPLNTISVPWWPAEIAYWWIMLPTYSNAYGLVLLSNPRFHWHMYSDLIVNALRVSPWSTFFVHPNGTWAFFDQSQVYNPNGVPAISLLEDGRDNYASLVDASLFEHCIYDRVHMEFTLAANTKYSVDSRFMDLYNQAVALAVKAKKIPPGEVFQSIAPVDLKATFTKLPDGTVSPKGIDIRAHWYGTDYTFSDATVSHGPGFAARAGGNSGTIDLSMDYLFGGSSPQAAAQHITFSSCLLIETD